MLSKTLALTAAICALGISAQACNKADSDGSAQKTTGQVESAAGSLTGSEKLKEDGKKDEVVGGVKSAVDDVKDAAHDAAKN